MYKTISKIEERIVSTIKDPCTSNWLKEAIRESLKRDCVDAMCDAQELAGILGELVKFRTEGK